MSSEAPQVSVVIPLYNHGAEVRRALSSVLAQTFRDFEVLVVDDGSTDDGPEVVKQSHDPRIRVISQENSGVSGARNRGIAEAQASVVAFLDADDAWKPCFLEEIVRLRAAYRSARVFATAYTFCDGAGVRRTPVIRGIPRHPWDGILEDYFDVASRSDPPLWTSAVAVAKPAITSVEGFPVGVKNGEDLLTWARLGVKHSIAYSTRPCALFWRPLHVDHRPGRYDDSVDIVGQELRRLLTDLDGRRQTSLRKYIGVWHRMRASEFLQLGNCDKARYEIRKSVRLGGMTPKLFLYRMVAVLPPSLSKRLMQGMIKGQRVLRDVFGSALDRGSTL